jgi:hypothetical protein
VPSNKTRRRDADAAVLLSGSPRGSDAAPSVSRPRLLDEERPNRYAIAIFLVDSITG